MSAPAGGEILYLVINLADRQHAPLSPTFDKDFYGGCDWINMLSGGKTNWIGTVKQVTLPGSWVDYDQPEYGGREVNRRAMYDALIALLDLKNRTYLHRCVIDISGYGWQMASGEVMWGPIDPTSVYGSFANSGNFVHELLHTYYLGHYGFCAIPVDPDHVIPLGTMGSEIMGIGEPVYTMCAINRIELGWMAFPDLTPVPAWGGTFQIASGHGIQIPLTPAGAAYVVEMRAGMVYCTVRMPTHVGGYSVCQLPVPPTFATPVIADTYRGITVMATQQGTTSATIKVTTPVAPPAPTPTPAPVPGTIHLPRNRKKNR